MRPSPNPGLLLLLIQDTENLSPCCWHQPSLVAPRLGEKKLVRPRPQEEAGRAAPPSSVSFGTRPRAESAPGLPKNPRDRVFPTPCRTAQGLGEHWQLHFLLPNRRMRQPHPTSDPPTPAENLRVELAQRVPIPCHHTSCSLLATSPHSPTPSVLCANSIM